MRKFKVNLDSGNSMWELEARNLHDILGLVGKQDVNQQQANKKWFKLPKK